MRYSALIHKQTAYGFSFVLYSQLQAQDNTIKKEKFNWDRGDQDTTAGYAQAVKVDNVVYISGTVARDVNPEGIKRVYEAWKKHCNITAPAFKM